MPLHEVRLVCYGCNIYHCHCLTGRKDKRAGKVEDYTDDDTLSTTSTGASSDVGGPPEVEEEFDESTLMDSFVEALYQKRYIKQRPENH